MTTSYEPGTPTPEGFIPLCVPEIRGNEWTYIKECLDTNWVSSAGPFVERFEEAVASYVGRTQAVATVNGTAALHIALLVAGVQPDDEVLVSSLTFIAPVNAIRYVGAWPVFIDAESEYFQMDHRQVVRFLDHNCHWNGRELRNRATGRRVKAILPVHILGHPVDLDPILNIAKRYGVVVIEDATESLGAAYHGRMVGSLGDIACFSFNGNKIITTGGGGMIVTDMEEWAQRAKYLITQAKDDPLEYIHHEIGFNYRLTNIQAALGCAQLELLPTYIEAKRAIAERYSEAFSGLAGLGPMREAPWSQSIFWMYTVLVHEKEFGTDSRGLLRSLSRAGIQSRPLWQPAHLSPAHQGAYAEDCSTAEHLNRTALCLPCSVGLRPEAQERVIAVMVRESETLLSRKSGHEAPLSGGVT